MTLWNEEKTVCTFSYLGSHIVADRARKNFINIRRSNKMDLNVAKYKEEMLLLILLLNNKKKFIDFSESTSIINNYQIFSGTL